MKSADLLQSILRKKAEKGQNFVQMFILDINTMFSFQFTLKWNDVDKFVRYLIQKNEIIISSCQHFCGSPPAAYFFSSCGIILLTRPAEKSWRETATPSGTETVTGLALVRCINRGGGRLLAACVKGGKPKPALALRQC